MRQQILTMLDMQNSMNKKIHPDWIDQNYEWYRAIWIECGELMDHFGYKWWKKQCPDLEQVKLEIIDIWHFGMSALFFQFTNKEEIADYIINSFKRTDHKKLLVRDATEELACWCLKNKNFSPEIFKKLMDSVELDFDTLYVSYVGKNVLNFFRQDHGYKDGSYKKIWDGKEDNEHLVELTSELDLNSTDFRDDLYSSLEIRYKQLSSC